jgi:8-oxo-dGTP pyrophosphatase MutT (NUDIX family)
VSDTADSKQAGRKSGTRRRQVAALPWRTAEGEEGGALEILLVSSRETRRWVIPKGWPMKGKSDRQAAAQEAYEEAGLDGQVADKAVGDYPYLKRLKSGAGRPVTVDVYPLLVTGEHATWPEKGQRTLQWMSPVEAALAVQEPELRQLIARFAGVELPAEERPAPAPAPTPVRVALTRLRRRITVLWGRRRRWL